MELQVIASDSSGNGYLLKAKNETLLIECGCHINQIKQALDFNLKNVTAIVSHAHGDHAKYIKSVLEAGIPVYANEHTLTEKNLLGHHRVRMIEAGLTYKIGGFKVKPFNVNHDVPTLGFLIHHEEMGLTVFLTDTCYSNYTFSSVNHFIVECNHDTEIMENNGTPTFLKNRIVKSHMNMQTCKELLLANDLSKVHNIVLIHLSNNNSDAIRFKKEIAAITGKTVFIAEKGLLIENFTQNPF